MKKQYLDCAEVINKHGYDGTLKLRHRCDGPKTLTGLKNVYRLQNGNYVPTAVTRASVFKDFVLMHLDGVDSEGVADAMRGEILYANRDDLPLPAGTHFVADLIGLPVFHADSGERIGTLHDVTFGAQTYYVVQNESGLHDVPKVPFVVRVDEESGVYIRPIPGLLEDDGDAL